MERIPKADYQVLGAKEPAEEAGCHNSFQDVTFVISLVVQLAVLIFSLVTLGIGNPPPLLQLILVLETVVQAVEFVWYSVIGALYFFKKSTFGVEYRYIDWVVTTPIMLITLFFLVIYFHSPCMEVAKLVDFPGFAGLLVLIVLMDWIMLFLGCMVEANWFKIREKSWARWLLFLGFIPLCLAFIAHIMAATERPSDEAVAVIVPTFILWTLYGVVAIAAYGDDRAQWRNAFYNPRPALQEPCWGRCEHRGLPRRVRGGGGRRRGVAAGVGNVGDRDDRREPAAGATAAARAQLGGGRHLLGCPRLLLRDGHPVRVRELLQLQGGGGREEEDAGPPVREMVG